MFKKDRETGLYDWCPGERGRWLGRYSGKKLIRDIPVHIVTKIKPVGSIKDISILQYLLNLYRQNLLTGQAKQDIEEVIGKK